jgi:menaquinone-dependent protoporphyrinogen oxidase
MKVLICWGTKLGGTEGIARILGAELEKAGHEVTLQAARAPADVGSHDAVLLGGALYANRWHRDARDFVDRHQAALRRVPVWMFSSGPLDDSADRGAIAPTREVAVLMERVGAVGHVTFGGRMPADARGFPAAAMAKTHAGDWRNPEHVRAWAADIARALPYARPEPAIDHPGRTPGRLVAHGVAGWAIYAAIAGAASYGPRALALTVGALAAPLVFAAIASYYFRGRGARAALPTAIAFTAIVAGLDAIVVAGLFQRSAAMFGSVVGTWLPLALIFATTWITGSIIATLPWPRPPRHADHAPPAAASRA